MIPPSGWLYLLEIKSSSTTACGKRTHRKRRKRKGVGGEFDLSQGLPWNNRMNEQIRWWQLGNDSYNL